MNIKLTGQRHFSSPTKETIRGEMSQILPQVRRVGATSHVDGSVPAGIRSFSRRGLSNYSLKIFSIAALAMLSCAAQAQENGAPAPAPATNAAPADNGAPATNGEATQDNDSGTTTPPGYVGIVASNVPIERVISQLQDKSGVSISARGKVPGQRASLIEPRPIPLRDALNKLVNTQPDWLLYEPDDRPGTYEIWDQETYKTEVLPRLVRPKIFIPKEITAEEATKALEGVMTPGIGKITFDPRSNKVIMTDLVEVLEIAQRYLETIDVKFYTRIYYIEHADLDSVAEKLSALKSPAAPDVQTDARTRQIIVSDRIDILQKMEQIVETLDIGPEMRVYTINNLGIEGEELEELEIAIEEILTPEAYFHFNIRQGRLIVRDLPEVHDRVEQVLAAFDNPVKQVLVQLEIVETEFTDGFNWSLDYAFSGDLLGAVTDGLVSGIPTGGVTDGDGDIVDGSEGFVNFRKEFPVIQAGSSGINASMLTRHAYVSLKTAMSDSRTRILQQPRALVQNQKPATFHVGQRIPYLTGGSIGVQQNNNNNIYTPSQPVMQHLDVGLDIEVIPVISGNGIVEMEMSVENSTPIFRDLTFNNATFTGVGKNDQYLETTLWIPSGQTRVIGGLVTDSKSESKTGVPGLSKIPVVGPALFSSYRKDPADNRRRNLLIFVTPTVVEDDIERMQSKYAGNLVIDVPQDELTTPPATISDIGTPFNTAQLEKGGYLPYSPPPLPDFAAMSQPAGSNRGGFSSGQTVLLQASPDDNDASLPSLGIEANVDIRTQPAATDLDAISISNDSIETLPRMTIEDTREESQVSRIINIGAGAPTAADDKSTGSRTVVRPAATPAPAAQPPAQGGQPAAAQPAQPGQPTPAPAAAAEKK